jgi:hypothetical protein
MEEKQMGNAPYSKRGQLLATDAPPVAVEESFLAHYQIAAANAILGTAASVLAVTGQGAAVKAVLAGITNPGAPRNVTITGGASGQAGNVTVKGTNFAGAAISESPTLSGTATVVGNKAFATVTEIDLPIQTHAPVLQVATATVVGTIGAAGTLQVETATIVAGAGITGAGNAKIIVTSNLLTGSPKTYEVAVALSDTASQVAAKVIAALGADTALTALYTVGGTGATVTLTTILTAANDGTLNVSSDNDTCTGLTTEASSANTTAGVRSGAGNAAVVVTGAALAGTPKTFAVAVANSDSASVVAGKIRAALAADGATATAYAVTGSGATVVLTANVAALNDATLNISTDNGTCAGLTTEATSVATTAGSMDTVSVGIGSKLGVPYHRPRNTVAPVYLNNALEGSAPTVAFDDVNIENNTVTLASTLNGSQVDIYLIV